MMQLKLHSIAFMMQARNARRCDSYLQSETINHWPTHSLTDRGRCQEKRAGLRVNGSLDRQYNVIHCEHSKYWKKGLQLACDKCTVWSYGPWGGGPGPYLISQTYVENKHKRWTMESWTQTINLFWNREFHLHFLSEHYSSQTIQNAACIFNISSFIICLLILGNVCSNKGPPPFGHGLLPIGLPTFVLPRFGLPQFGL